MNKDALYQVLKDTKDGKIRYHDGCLSGDSKLVRSYVKFMRSDPTYSIYLDNSNNWEVTPTGEKFMKDYETQPISSVTYQDNRRITNNVADNQSTIYSNSSFNVKNVKWIVWISIGITIALSAALYFVI